MALPALRLRRHEDRRIRLGHPWVFSNEVDTDATPLGAFEPGQPAVVQSATGDVLGSVYVNPASLICARIVSPRPDQPLDASVLERRLAAALRLRESLFSTPYYRLAFAESDALPGLVVDRYGAQLVVQITTAGMERLKDDVVAVLARLLAPKGILLRNDLPLRALEGLSQYVAVAHGEVPEETGIVENGCHFSVPLLTGQKTGWFFDQRANRERMTRYVRGLRVLDLFSYLGSWGVMAARAGATDVLCVDTSASATAQIERHAQNNGVAHQVGIMTADVFDALRKLRAQEQRFDVIILDPPAFIRRRKDATEGVAAYRRLNQAALAVLADDGLVISSSCSYHLHRETLHDIIAKAARRAGRFLQILEEGQQAPDHPVHPALPESAYLKTVFARMRPPV
ncbi:MAG: class I SAM-dependent rRNA methyltransferase [Acidiferrobacteraceae bacterium]